MIATVKTNRVARRVGGWGEITILYRKIYFDIETSLNPGGARRHEACKIKGVSEEVTKEKKADTGLEIYGRVTARVDVGYVCTPALSPTLPRGKPPAPL